MDNFIVTVYLRINAYTEDKLAVGLLYSGSRNIFFNWSDAKLQIALKFLEPNSKRALSKELNNLKKSIESNNGALIYDHCFSSEYFTYLRSVDDVLITFSDPNPVSNELDADKFDNLFKVYIEGNMKAKPAKEMDNFHAKFKQQLNANPIFYNRADLDYKVLPSIISSIYNPLKIDFISVNGSILAGFVLDFDQTPVTIENKFYEYRALTEGFKEFSHKKGLDAGNYLAFYNDPGDNLNKKEMLENAFNDSTLPFELKEGEKLNETAEILEKKDYRKFSDFIT